MAAGGTGPSGARLTRRLAAWRRRAGGRCAVCRGWCDGGLCVCCESRFAFAQRRCDGCALPLAGTTGDVRCVRCRLAPPPWSRAVTGVDYGYPWDRLLADFKFHQRLECVDALLQPLLGRLPCQHGSDLRLVAVPLSRERLRERGYNQSHELAKALARRRGLRCEPDMLLRVRHNERQAGLKLEARTANVRGVFAIEPLRAAKLRGTSVALLDDVMTSGATLYELARVLLQAGVMSVQAWVIARTPEPGDE